MKTMTFRLPKWIVMLHGHPRDMEQAYKMTVLQYILESYASLIRCMGLMPNTNPPISDIKTLLIYLNIIKKAMEELGLSENDCIIYVFFGANDNNIEDCNEALDFSEVIGIKIYPIGVTTGNIGVSLEEVIYKIMAACAKKDKPVAIHCDDPEIIKKYGYIKEAEISFVHKCIEIGRLVPGVKIIFCHMSCKESVELIDKAIKEGLNAIIEICAQYLWFTKEGHNWNKLMDPAVYYAFNNIRGLSDREFLRKFVSTSRDNVFISGDSAPHTFLEKVTRFYPPKSKRIGGMATHKHMVAVTLTLAAELSLTEKIVAKLLYGNINRFLKLDLPDEMISYEIEKRKDYILYNHGIVPNPWWGSELWFPKMIKEE